MNILIDIGHPAHVHFFRNAIDQLKAQGHTIIITAREKRGVIDLLDQYQLPYVLASREWRSKLPILRYFQHTFTIWWLAIRKRPSLVLSISSPMAAWASILSGSTHFTFDDTEHASLEHSLYLPGTRRVYTPTSFTKDLGTKQVRYPGFHELAYLHPNWFTPDPGVLAEAGLQPGEPFFILRTVAWKAAHDRGHSGMSAGEVEVLMELLRAHGKVAVSTESKSHIEINGRQLHPSRMHHLLAYASMYIGEGGTMATEATLLGTPSIFVNTLTAGNWQELEGNYGLLFTFPSGGPAIAKAEELLNNPNLKADWQKKRVQLLEDKIDVTEFVVKEMGKFLETRGQIPPRPY